LYVLLTSNDTYPFRAFDIPITDELRAKMKKGLIRETRDIDDAIELKDPTLVRHVRFDDRYNWKCVDCSHQQECDSYLLDEIRLPVDKRRWWDIYCHRRTLTIPKKYKETIVETKV
jgi:hypothetical protein